MLRGTVRKPERAPGHHSAREIRNARDVGMGEELGRESGAPTGLTNDYHGLVDGHFFHARPQFVEWDVLCTYEMAELAGEFRRLSHVKHVHFEPVQRNPFGSDVGLSRVSDHDRSPGGRCGRLAAFGLASAHVCGHRNGHLFGMRQAEVGHVTDEILFASRAADAGVVLLFFADGARGAPQVVMSGIDDAVVGEREELLSNRAEQQVCVALLKVGASCAAHEQRVSGEHHLSICHDEGYTAIRMPRGRAHLNALGTEANGRAVYERQVHVLRTVGR